MAYLTAAEVKDRLPILDKANPPADLDTIIEELVAEFEAIAEEYRGVAFEPRTAVETFPTVFTNTVLLSHPMVTAVTAVTVDGTALTSDERGLLEVESWGKVTTPSGWYGKVVVTYTHGHAEPPPAVLRGCREFVRAKVLEGSGNGPRNAISYQDDSGWSYRDSTADWAAGRPTGLRVVDDALNSLPDHRTIGVA